jgi:hypothetical protein
MLASSTFSISFKMLWRLCIKNVTFPSPDNYLRSYTRHFRTKNLIFFIANTSACSTSSHIFFQTSLKKLLANRNKNKIQRIPRDKGFSTCWNRRLQTSIAPRFRIHRYPNKTTPISQKFIVQKASSSPAFFKSEKLLVKVTLTIKKMKMRFSWMNKKTSTRRQQRLFTPTFKRKNKYVVGIKENKRNGCGVTAETDFIGFFVQILTILQRSRALECTWRHKYHSSCVTCHLRIHGVWEADSFILKTKLSRSSEQKNQLDILNGPGRLRDVSYDKVRFKISNLFEL